MALRYNNRYKKPQKNKDVKVRKCISKLSAKCLGEFESDGPGNRICRACKDIISRKWVGQEPIRLNIRR